MHGRHPLASVGLEDGVLLNNIYHVVRMDHITFHALHLHAALCTLCDTCCYATALGRGKPIGAIGLRGREGEGGGGGKGSQHAEQDCTRCANAFQHAVAKSCRSSGSQLRSMK